MKLLMTFLIACLLSSGAMSQKYYTKNGSIEFFSKSPMENIDAKNGQVMSVINTATGDLQFFVIIRAFHFKKALMEEHFNENYLESAKFPKATFKGACADLSKINFSRDGSYPTSVTGDLMIHGVTKNVTVPGQITVKNGIPSATAKFNITLADYNVSIPKVVKDNISEKIDITIDCTYDQKM